MLEPTIHPNEYSPELEEAHADLLATIAASRELGPDMDKALAESYLQRHAAPPSRRRQRGVIAQPSSKRAAVNMPFVMRSSAAVLALVIFLALLVASGGHLFWLFWLPFAFGGWRWFGGSDRHTHYHGHQGSRGGPHYPRERAHDERIDQRRDDRDDRDNRDNRYDYI